MSSGLEGSVDAGLSYEQVAPELGFREYWYPLCLARQVGKNPFPTTVLGQPVVLVRRNGRVYALADECPHRGTRLSLGRCEFPGSRTLTCVYHGWTFDVATGQCVAALTDGPDSRVVGRARVKTYPLEERKGILWIWPGEGQPVRPEEDIPAGILRATIIRVVQRLTYGNWRWHIENPGMGHAMMLHRTSAFMRVRRFPGFVKNFTPELSEENEDGLWLRETCHEVSMDGDFPGLGRWPKHHWWESIVREDYSPLLGVSAKVSLRLPGLTRVIHFPINGAMYYEWFVQTDPEHYNFFQVCCGYPNTAREKAWFLARYYLWGRWAGMIRFNNQDLLMVRSSQEYVKRRGAWNPPSHRLFRPDQLQIAWRQYVLKNARRPIKVEEQYREVATEGRSQSV
jgi:phenylpropionate dioxygenase-like ring-hydroxylating dioxygenase large terminal subunit